MKERRPLSTGLNPPGKPVDPEVAKKFIRGEELSGGGIAEIVTGNAKPRSSIAQELTRVPLSTRIRGDLFAALKRASLERQLNKVEPHTLIEILEQAVEPWLRANGYIR